MTEGKSMPTSVKVIIAMFHGFGGLILLLLFDLTFPAPDNFIGSISSLVVYDKWEAFIILSFVAFFAFFTAITVKETIGAQRIIGTILSLLYVLMISLIEHSRISAVVENEVELTALRVVLDLGMFTIVVSQCIFLYKAFFVGRLTSGSS